jgi:hypothetical protein
MIDEIVELNKNQNGGARPGAGRKSGSTNKLRVTDFFNGEERDRLVLEAKLLAFGDGESKPDKDMVKFLFEQLFGKAKQTTIQEDEEGNQLAPLLVKILKDGRGNSN